MLTKLPVIYDLYNHLAKCLNRFLIVKAVVSAFNNKKALVGAFIWALCNFAEVH